MENHNLQLVKQHKKWLIVISIIAASLVGVIYFVSTSGDKGDMKMNAVRPLVKYQEKLYAWDEDVRSLPQDILSVGEIKKSYNSGTVAVEQEDANFTSNVSSVGSKLYQQSEDVIYVEDDAVISKYVLIPWEEQ